MQPLLNAHALDGANEATSNLLFAQLFVQVLLSLSSQMPLTLKSLYPAVSQSLMTTMVQGYN